MKLILPLLVFYASSVVMSVALYTSLVFSFLKSITDSGFTIKLNNSSNISDKEKEKEKDSSLNKMIFSLGLNIFTPFRILKNYDQFYNDMLSHYKNNLVPLENYEKQEYAKRPTGFKAFMIMEKRYINNDLIKTLNIITDEGSSKVVYLIKKKGIKILEVTGPIEKLSVKEQENLILDNYSKIMMDLLTNEDDPQEILEKVINTNNYTCDNRTSTQKEEFSYKIAGGEVIWKYTDDFDDIIIMETKGEAKNLSIEKIKELIINDLSKVYSNYVQNWNSLNEYLDNDNPNMNRTRKK